MGRRQPNLLRRYVASPRLRKAAYAILVLYLVLCGLALVYVANQATYRLINTVHQRYEIDRLERAFRRLYPAATGDLTQVASRLQGELEQTQGRLEQIQRTLNQRSGLSWILAGVVEPLSPQVRLVRLDMDRSRGTVVFDLAMPDTPDGQAAQAGSLVETWAAAPLLQGRLEDLRILARNVQRSEDRSVVLLRVEGRLVVKKGA